MALRSSSTRTVRLGYTLTTTAPPGACFLTASGAAVTEQLSFLETNARSHANPLAGLKVRLERGCQCGHGVLITGEGRGPHRASLICEECARHCGWLSTEAPTLSPR